MRTIKFRAWKKVKDNERMIEWEELKGTTDRNFPNLSILTCTGYEWMQFTGLLDRNGKEIYEGDIIQGYARSRGKEYKSSHRTRVVKWQETFVGCGFNVVKRDKRLLVIGNIHENPDILSR